MNELDTDAPVRGSRMRIARSRGAASGFLLILLGVWGALIPFVGPYFDFAYSPDQAWVWTTARGWLEVLPGAVTVVGGLLLLSSRNRATAMLGGWLTVLAGGWFVLGRAFAGPLGLGDPGSPVAATDTKRVWMEVAYFSGLGALVVFLGAAALGRVSVRSLRDVQAAQPAVVGTEPTPQPAVTEDAAAGRPVDHEHVDHVGPEADHVDPETEHAPVSESDERAHRGFGRFRRRRQTTPAPPKR
jgi:hypothetical protein